MKEMKNENKEEGFLEIFKFKKKIKNENVVNQSINRSRNNMLNLEENNPNINNLKINKLHEQKGPLKSSINLNVFKEKRDTDKDSDSLINFNIFDYYCLRKISKKKTEIELFNFGINFYKRQMDIINFFNIIILTQIILTQKSEKKHNFLTQKIELSIK